jgi:hypothetical protein
MSERPIARKLVEAVRSLYLSRATGAIEVTHPGGAHRLFFREGELYLGAGDDIAGLFNGSGGGLATVLEAMESWTPAAVRAIDAASAETRLTGPLPTARWVMESGVRGRSDDELLALLGGERGRIVANSSGAASAAGPALDPEDAYLLSRLEIPSAVGDMLYQGTMNRHSALVRLCRLRSVELIMPADDGSSAGSVDHRLLPPALLDRFLERIAADLVDMPMTLTPAGQRMRVAQLLAQCGGMTHYEVLGVESDCAEDQIHRGYTTVARLVHPSQAPKLGLAGREPALLLLFERATRAYLTLNDPRRRAAYDVDIGLGTSLPGEEARRDERKVQARESFDRARELANAEDFHFAIELLRQAVVLDPMPEYYGLLAACQLRNPNWSRQALDAARAGLRLKPSDNSLRLLSAQALEKCGEIDEAAEEYLSVCDRDPTQTVAAEGLGRIATERGMQVEPFLRKLRAAQKTR